MTAFDYTVLGIIVFSLLIGLLRGAIKEVLSLVGWVAAFWVANSFAGELAVMLAPTIKSPGLRMIAAYVGLFVVVLLVVGLLKLVLSGLIKAVGLGGIDMVLGGVVGVVRGVLIALIAVLACGMTSLPEEPFWREATSAKWFETIAVAAKPWLPDELAKRINFHSPMKA